MSTINIPDKPKPQPIPIEEKNDKVIQEKNKWIGISRWLKENPGYSFPILFIASFALQKTVGIFSRRFFKESHKLRGSAYTERYAERKFWKSKGRPEGT